VTVNTSSTCRNIHEKTTDLLPALKGEVCRSFYQFDEKDEMVIMIAAPDGYNWNDESHSFLE
jgi:hypothetical protein